MSLIVTNHAIRRYQRRVDDVGRTAVMRRLHEALDPVVQQLTLPDEGVAKVVVRRRCGRRFRAVLKADGEDLVVVTVH